MSLRRVLHVVVPFSLTALAFAQNINVDVGTFYAAPSSGYGAGANQPGPWNTVDPSLLGVAQALPLDTAGNACSATLKLVSGTPFDFHFNNALTTGDDELLLDDGQDGDLSPNNNSWQFAGLAPGRYRLMTYAWSPNSANDRSRVTCGTLDPFQLCGGAWTGVHQLGVTYTQHRIDVTAGTLNVSISPAVGFATINAFQLSRETVSSPFCEGNVVGTTCTGCGNNGSAGNGCANSAFAAGGHLANTGFAGASAATDSLVLTATNVPGPGLFFQATGLAASPVTFGDGMLCASTGIVRLGVVFPNAGGSASFPGGLTPSPIHVGGATAPGDVRHYQCWYRDAAAFCTTATFNTTNGVTLTWGL